MSKILDEIAKRVAEEQSALEGNTESTRDRVIRMGTEVREAQVQQKKEQKEQEAKGLEVQTWKQWCEEQKGSLGAFPAVAQCKQYTLIAHPLLKTAYLPGMSIKEAYKEAGKWKKNGYAPPPKEKLTIVSRPLVTIGAACGKLDRKIEAAIAIDPTALKRKEAWTDDEIDGCLDALSRLRKSVAALASKLKALVANEVH